MKHVKQFESFLFEGEDGALFEGDVPLLSILGNPASLIFGSDKSDDKKVYLAQKDAKGNTVPGTKYLYSIGGTYSTMFGKINFDVQLRNVNRTASGALTAEAKPSSSVVHKVLKTLAKKEFLTSDSWLKVSVPKDKVNSAIASLKSNQGKKATIDAGHGVSLKISYEKALG